MYWESCHEKEIRNTFSAHSFLLMFFFLCLFLVAYSGSQTELPVSERQELIVGNRHQSAKLGTNLNSINHVENQHPTVSSYRALHFWFEVYLSGSLAPVFYN